MEYFYYSSYLCILTLVLKFLMRKRILFYTPLTMFALVWLMNSLVMFYVFAHPETDGHKKIWDFALLGEVVFKFILAGIGGGFFAYVLTCFLPYKEPTPLKIDEFCTKVRYLLDKYRFILVLNLLFGISRFLIVLSYIDLTTLYDYRAFAALKLYHFMPGWQKLIFQISNHLYILAGFYIVLWGALIYFGKKIKLKTLLINFFLFSLPLMTTGGRLWILNFAIYFFSGFLMPYSLFCRDKSPNKVLKKLALLLFGLVVLVCAIGEARNTPLNDQRTAHPDPPFFSKLSYFMDGNVMLSNYMKCNFGAISNGGESTFGSAKTMTEMRETYLPQCVGYVNGLHSFLYFDFGLPDMYFVWFFLSFLIELAALCLISRFTLFSFLSGTALIKVMQESVIFNSIRGHYPFFEWIILLYVLSYIFSAGKKSRALHGHNALGNPRQ